LVGSRTSPGGIGSLMPTRSGWAVLAVSAAALTAGVLLALRELLVVGIVGVTLLAIASGSVWRRSHLTIERRIRPKRVRVGDEVRVDLVVWNPGPSRSRLVSMRDQVPGTVGAEVWVPPLSASREEHARYRLPTHRRGLLTVGTLRALHRDALGLTRRTVTVVPTADGPGLPRVEPVDSPAPFAGAPAGTHTS